MKFCYLLFLEYICERLKKCNMTENEIHELRNMLSSVERRTTWNTISVLAIIFALGFVFTILWKSGML